MLYALYLPDGKIHQVNKLYVGKDELAAYEERLHDQGQKFHKEPSAPGLLPPEKWMVNTSAIGLVKRPRMRASALAKTIKAGTNAVILNIPKGGVVVDIMTSNVTVGSFTLQASDDEIEFPIPVPCIYRAIIRKWPYQDCTIDIEAVA